MFGLDFLSRRSQPYYVSSPFRIGRQNWTYRASEGDYEWHAALEASGDGPFSDPFNPFAIYAYKMRDRELGADRYVLVLYPRGCFDSGCAEYISTEASDPDELTGYMEYLAKLAPVYYRDPEEFIDMLSDKDMYLLEPSELENFDDIKPTPISGEEIAKSIKKHHRGIEIKHIKLTSGKPSRYASEKTECFEISRYAGNSILMCNTPRGGIEVRVRKLK